MEANLYRCRYCGAENMLEDMVSFDYDSFVQNNYYDEYCIIVCKYCWENSIREREQILKLRKELGRVTQQLYLKVSRHNLNEDK